IPICVSDPTVWNVCIFCVPAILAAAARCQGLDQYRTDPPVRSLGSRVKSTTSVRSAVERERDQKLNSVGANLGPTDGGDGVEAPLDQWRGVVLGEGEDHVRSDLELQIDLSSGSPP